MKAHVSKLRRLTNHAMMTTMFLGISGCLLVSRPTPTGTSTPEMLGLGQTAANPPTTTLSNNLPTHNSPPVSEQAQPDILLGLSAERPPLLSCISSDAPAEVWLSHPPYVDEVPILRDSQAGYYSPAWSPDGEWIAFVEVLVSSITPSIPISEDTLRKDFPGSDSIWIMRPDGSERRQISEAGSRSEIQIINSSCVPIQGIRWIVGWSFDGQWVAYLTDAIEEDDPILKVVNVKGTSPALSKDSVLAAKWSPQTTEIATIRESDTGEQLAIFDISNPGAGMRLLSPPGQLSDASTIVDFAWNTTADALLVAMNSATLSLWKVEIASNEWFQLADLGAEHNARLGSTGNRAIACINRNGRGNLMSILLEDETPSQVVNIENSINCESVRALHNSNQPSLISFLDETNSAVRVMDIVTRLTRNRIDLATIDLPAGLYLATFEWRPQP